jgi:hypothetical protein
MMANTKLNGADYLLLLLYLLNKSAILGSVRLTKMMFLFKEEISKLLSDTGLQSNILPEFFAYNYGPFSKDVYEQVELFKGLNFIKLTNIRAKEEMADLDKWEEESFELEFVAKTNDSLNEDGKYIKYEIDDLGSKFVEEQLLPVLTHIQIKILERFKKKIITLSSKQILKYVYTKYPEYAKNSFIKSEIFINE